MNRSSFPLRLERMNYPQVAEYLRCNDLAIVPCGATEQHSRHLPLGVDAMTAIAVAEEAAEAEGVVLTPPLWFGWSPHHMGFPGTVSVRAETLIALTTDVTNSLLHHGFRKVLYVNGHRLANLPPLEVMATQVRADTGAVVVIADLGYLAQPEYCEAVQSKGSAGIGHADGYETAHMLHIQGDLVDRAALANTRAKPGHAGMRTIDPSVASSRAAWWPSTEAELVASGDGVSGDPLWGTEERGKILHEALVRDLVALIHEMKSSEPVVVTPRTKA